ncbi:hypothetical protein E1293_12455 [Actinomadura darangshiensis]|uniref:Uncharacterized protein n=1 Tax=Actinomadura darangshiensis TaxID=705336 RepID=A0A4R5BH58_9ACTN|nr:DUF6463 family protein [Actinomadura darangshiensis]TDD84779.1 hypothetical protein E1293_12455 [Actinomadura darangshiensis]
MTAATTSLRRWIPRLMLTVATAHVLVGLSESRSQWRGIVSEGLWNTVANDDDARMTALWFLLGGAALFSLGLLVRRSVIATGEVPAETGWILLVLGAAISVLEPASGGWSLLVLGALALAARPRTAGRRTAQGVSAGPAPRRRS